MINLKIITFIVILCLLIIHILHFNKFFENFQSSYPVYGSDSCERACKPLEDGYDFGDLCNCKKCCEDYPEPGCNSALLRLIDFFDWSDGKDCNFNE